MLCQDEEWCSFTEGQCLWTRKEFFIRASNGFQEQRSSRSAAHGPRQAVPSGAPNITSGINVFLQGQPDWAFCLGKSQGRWQRENVWRFHILRPVVIKSGRFIRIVSYGPLPQLEQKFCTDRRGHRAIEKIFAVPKLSASIFCIDHWHPLHVEVPVSKRWRNLEINQRGTWRRRKRGIIYDPNYQVRGMIQGFIEPHSVPASRLVQKSASWPRVFTNLAMACAVSLLYKIRVVGLFLTHPQSKVPQQRKLYFLFMRHLWGILAPVLDLILFLTFAELFQSS